VTHGRPQRQDAQFTGLIHAHYLRLISFFPIAAHAPRQALIMQVSAEALSLFRSESETSSPALR
jgi:hypothetical protein